MQTRTRARQDGATPLFMAAQEGQLEVARLLLNANADTDKATQDGATPFDVAAQRGHLEVLRLLQESNTDKSKRRKISVMRRSSRSFALWTSARSSVLVPHFGHSSGHRKCLPILLEATTTSRTACVAPKTGCCDVIKAYIKSIFHPLQTPYITIIL